MRLASWSRPSLLRTIYSKYIKESFSDRVLEDSLLAMVGAGIGGGLFLVTIVIIGEHENLMCFMVSLYTTISIIIVSWYCGIMVLLVSVSSSWSPSSSLVNFLHQRWWTREFLLKEANMRRNVELVAASNYWVLMQQTISDLTSKEQHIQFQVWYAWCARMRG